MDHTLLAALSKKQVTGVSELARAAVVSGNAEQKITDYFGKNGIRYTHRPGTRANVLVFKSALAKPRFYLDDYGVYVEYWELIGESREYEKEMKWKMAQYHRNNIRLISVYPKNLDRLDQVFRAKFKQVVGFDLPQARDGRPEPRRSEKHQTSKSSEISANPRP